MRRSSSNHPQIGLALSGGAARGIAHVGVFRALTENDIPIHCIAGTSAGSLVGGAIASGMPLAEIEAIARNLRWRDVGKMTVSRLGVQSNERMEQYLKEHLPVSRFEHLRIPFAAVATNLQNGEAVVMRDEGDVPFAIRASCCIPGWYVPVIDEFGRQLVDGGLVANIPASVARSLGADIVIAVDVNAEGAKFLGPSLSIIGIVLQSMLLVQRTVSLHELQHADAVIKPSVGHIRWDEMARADELLDAGYQAALEAVPRIREVIETAAKASSRWYQLRRRKSLRVKNPQASTT
ncbi:MAG TPA: patatin-like phospholipase family protein [Pyrinomonadaceae bacterium]|nr:patatin-like phospholipase family protein [Pyrinomonadaceae bacterium]